MKKKYLLLLTDYYPYEKWEPYVKNEMTVLPSYFDRVFIMCRYLKNFTPIYKLPLNTEVHSLVPSLNLMEKLWSMHHLFSSAFWKEWKFARKHYHLRQFLLPVKTMLTTLQIADHVAAELKSFIQKRSLDQGQIVVYSFWTDARALACSQLASNKNIIAISRSHGWDVYFERHNPPYLPFRKYLHDHLDAQYFVSDDGRNYSLQKIPGSNREKYRTSRLGTIDSGLNPDSASKELVIVTCSRLVSLKRLHLVVEILKYIQEIPVRWIHFGDGPLKESLLEKTNELTRRQANIQFEFKGDIENEELLKFYAANHIDLYLLTSEYEGMPQVIMEAFSFGIPAMATQVGGIAEMIDASCGFLLEKDFDPQVAANIMKEFYQLPNETKARLRDNARKRWDEKFNGAKNYPAFIEDVLGLRNRS